MMDEPGVRTRFRSQNGEARDLSSNSRHSHWLSMAPNWLGLLRSTTHEWYVLRENGQWLFCSELNELKGSRFGICLAMLFLAGRLDFCARLYLKWLCERGMRELGTRGIASILWTSSTWDRLSGWRVLVYIRRLQREGDGGFKTEN